MKSEPRQRNDYGNRQTEAARRAFELVQEFLRHFG
ncbi:hypothetical protein OPIT5_12255 [Opitutaceae bacterium TAV5]|nr:hypothetical protein OPIT5_12255 [Opitutaceae bacterium TAV5]